MSALASTMLGHLAIRLTDFRSTVGGTATQVANNPFSATFHMIRITAFLLDPMVALLVGAVVGAWSNNKPASTAAIAVLPLAAFAAYSYPWLRWGIVAGLIDILAAVVTAEAAYRIKSRGLAATRSIGN